MTLIADILMVAGALGAGLYCFVLARRLSKFNDLEAGVGGAVAVLSAQVDDMTRTLKAAQKTAGVSAERLESLTQRAEGVSKRMELMLASMHDLPEAVTKDAVENPIESEPPQTETLETSSETEDDFEDEAEEDAEAEYDAAFEAAALEAAEEEKRLRKKKKNAKRKAKRKAAKEAAAAPKKKKKASKASAKPEAQSAPVFTRHVA
ncbi:hypothetical protein SAMN04488037_101322 [Shimia marina]|uniref:Uncharacterized protein n=1 Tax=Shimia marina TaxID=321267 RepID=A0A0P1ELL1_9RHOB|nr:hypothetical protein SHM7688_00785 [Shimia marina]SFD51374.1 hypothetical protein SAMN04488037_101322 [Shimia marina]